MPPVCRGTFHFLPTFTSEWLIHWLLLQALPITSEMHLPEWNSPMFSGQHKERVSHFSPTATSFLSFAVRQPLPATGKSPSSLCHTWQLLSVQNITQMEWSASPSPLLISVTAGLTLPVMSPCGSQVHPPPGQRAPDLWELFLLPSLCRGLPSFGLFQMKLVDIPMKVCAQMLCFSWTNT